MLYFVLFVLYVFSEVYSTKSYGQSATSNVSLLWGPYRPKLYVGIRPRMPNSLTMGLMWSGASNPTEISKSTYHNGCRYGDTHSNLILDLRHTCEQDEAMASYGWTAYDVRKGGTHIVNDTGNKLDLITHFVKASDDENYVKWGLRVGARPSADGHDRQKSTVILYLGVEESGSTVECNKEHKTTTSKTSIVCNGMTAGLGNLRMQISDNTADSVSHWTSIQSVTVPVDTIWQAKSIWLEQLQNTGSPDGPRKGNLLFIQKTFEGGSDLDILFSSGINSKAMASTSLTEDIQNVQSTFDDSFNSAFSPQPPFQDERHVTFSQYPLSNLMGGIGYFHGTSIVDKSSAPEYAETDLDFWGKAATARSRAIVQEEGPFQLFTSVPSRPFFPRGSLWDEGFHLQVIIN